MTHARLNLIVRALLGAAVIAGLLLTIISARPGYRFLGFYPAALETPAAIDTGWGETAVSVLLAHPAVVAFPPEWGLADQVCVVLMLARGTAPTALAFSDRPPQIRWDDRPGDTVIFGPVDVLGRENEGGRLIVSNGLVAPHVGTHLPYRVRWIGHEDIPLYSDQPQGGVLCYHFMVTSAGRIVMRIPFWHRLSFSARNIAVARQPAFNFLYNTPALPGDLPATRLLSRERIEPYLERLSREAPFAVQPMTPAQIEQRAAEWTRGIPIQ